MGRFVLVLLLMCGCSHAELLQAVVQGVVRQPNGSPIPVPFFFGETLDQQNPGGGKYTMRLCLDDSSWNCASGNGTTINANTTLPELVPCTDNFPFCAQWAWQPPAGKVGSVTPRDGNYHNLYVWAISQRGDSAANNKLADFSPLHFKWDSVNNNLAPDYAPDLSSSTPATPAQFAVWADSSQAYSVGKSGNTICTVGGTAIKDDGVVGYFVATHSIPCANVQVVTLGTTTDAIMLSTFNRIFQAKLRALPSSIQYNVLGWMRPNVVVGAGDGTCQGDGGSSTCYGISGWMTMYPIANGAEPSGSSCIQQTAGLGAGPPNPWFNSGADATPFSTSSVRPTIMLAAGTCPTCTKSSNASNTWVESVPTMTAVIDAAAAAVGTNPTGNVQIAYTTDPARGGTAASFPPSLAGTALSGYIDYTMLGSFANQVSPDVTSGITTDVLMYYNAASAWNYPKIGFIPGAGMGYSVTSFSAKTNEGGTGQTPWISWLGGGTGGVTGTPAVAASGTGVEPCESLPMKMMNPELFTQYYVTGWDILQAAWKAQRDPWNVNLTGDPFAQPYSATAPSGGLSIPSAGVVNSAGYTGGVVAPGELVTIFGTGIGPATLSNLQLDSVGHVASALSGVQVLFDGLAAPMIYASATQVGAIVPYEVDGQASTQMQIVYQGQKSNVVTLPVATAVPGIYSLDASGSGPGAIINQDGTLNSSSNPAAPGSAVSLYGTGEGQTNPPGQDGVINGSPAPSPNQTVTATIGGVDAPVLYAGGSSGLVAGVMQINLQIPAGVSGDALPVLINVGGASSQAGLTVSVQDPNGTGLTTAKSRKAHR